MGFFEGRSTPTPAITDSVRRDLTIPLGTNTVAGTYTHG